MLIIFPAVEIGGEATSAQWSLRGNGDGMPAHGDPAQHVKPQAAADVTANRKPARDRPGRLG